MTIGSILLGVALLVGVGLFVTRPIFVHDPQRRRRMSQRKALTLQKEAILTEIRALDFDYETGKVAEEEYRQGREAYVAEAAELLQRIDALDERFLDTEATPAAEQPAAEQPAAEQPKVAGQPELEFDEIEAAIARRRGKAAPAAAPAPKATRPKQKARVGSGQAGGGFCPQCGQPADPDDRFCAFCGHQLTEPQHA
jgi:hypothetical protein